MKQDSSSIKVKLYKATDLIRSRTTASGIQLDFQGQNYPLFFHSYHPENSFMAVPPEWLKDILVRAGETKLAEEIENKVEQTKQRKDDIFSELKERFNKEKMADKED